MGKAITVKLDSRIPQLRGQARARAGAMISKAVFDVEALAKVNAPVLTGNLRNSIEGVMTGELEGEVRVGADYALPVEFGRATSNGGYVPGRYYLSGAVNSVAPSLEAGLEKVLD